MTKRKSRSDLSAAKDLEERRASDQQPYENVEFASEEGSASDKANKQQGLSRKGFLNKFRRSMSMSAESASELTLSLGGGNKPKSMFYLTESIDVDGVDVRNDSGLPASPVQRNGGAGGGGNNRVVRPSSPPPPIPIQHVGELKVFEIVDLYSSEKKTVVVVMLL